MNKYSIVIITYQMKEILANCLEAINGIRGITESNFEVIVSDDGSTDGTDDYIKGINRNYKMTYVYSKRDAKSCRNRARNLGIGKAAGDIVVLLDGDIIVRENLLFELERCFSKDKNIIVAGARLLLSDQVEYQDIKNRSLFHKYYFDRNNIKMLDDRYLKYDTLSYNAKAFNHCWLMAHTCIVAIPKEALILSGGFDEDITGWGFDESELMYRFYQNGVNIIINSRIEVLHQKHNEHRGASDSSQVKEFRDNIEYFFHKHADALKLLPKDLGDYFMEDRMLELLTPDLDHKRKVILEFRKTDQLEEIKDILLNNLDNDNLIYVVYDYLENTDIDIWIQLLKKSACIIQYFPVSKCINIKKHKNLRITCLNKLQ